MMDSVLPLNAVASMLHSVAYDSSYHHNKTNFCCAGKLCNLLQIVAWRVVGSCVYKNNS